MPHSTGFFKSHDGLNLFYRYHQVEPTENLLIILHGHGEHSGRYVKFYDRLKSISGLSIAIYDARGNGQSEGRPAYVNSFEDYMRDVDTFSAYLSTQFTAPQRFVLLGHSLGGLVALQWALKNQSKLKGLILSSPCLGLRLPAWIIRMNRFIDKFLPSFYYSHPIYPPHLSHNQEEVELYKKDTLIQRKMSPRLLDEMVRKSSELVKQLDQPVSIPISMLLSEKEKVVDLSSSIRVYDLIQTPFKRMKIFKGLYHEIFNEIDQDEVFQALESDIRDILQHSH